MKLTKTPNRLINEKSPYLLQHAYNPVDWYPWGEAAFAKAQKEDKPVFLSIGYSTCHWCHVMERESFENRKVAEILNRHYVSVKVDREERPDIDTIYMAVCQAVTGHGGWPLTIIMTPEKKPFFAGTYFPPESSRGLPGLKDILTWTARMWSTERERVEKAGRDIKNALDGELFAHRQGKIDAEILHRAFSNLENSFDPVFGGFGTAPKFPTPHNLTFLLRYWKLTSRPAALEMVEKTLNAMYLGGIYDHIGFGFARYSTDRRWLVPHFEKMLYDNALLAMAYLEAFQATGKKHYARVAQEVFTYVLRDMTSPEGAFYAAEDADSEGEEGKFYLWTPDEVKDVLGREEGSRFCRAYNITASGNFAGQSIPNLIDTGLIEGFAQARDKLFRHREKRVRPFRDDKVLTAWNGLMIAAMACGARVLGDKGYALAAGKAADFIMKRVRRDDGRLLARYREGEAAYPAYADDYAFLIWGLIELYQATFRPAYLRQALELNNDLLKYFWDNKQGGLYQYGSDAETLISRPKEIYDGAMPAGNSVAAVNFLRLARLTGDAGLADTARRQLEAFGGTISEAPHGHACFLTAVYLSAAPPVDLTIVGDLQAADTQAMIKIANTDFRPAMLLMVKSPGTPGGEPAGSLPQLADRHAVEGKATAYVCRDFTCHPPVTAPRELARLLE